MGCYKQALQTFPETQYYQKRTRFRYTNPSTFLCSSFDSIFKECPIYFQCTLASYQFKIHGYRVVFHNIFWQSSATGFPTRYINMQCDQMFTSLVLGAQMSNLLEIFYKNVQWRKYQHCKQFLVLLYYYYYLIFKLQFRF